MRKGIAIFLCLLMILTTLIIVPAPSKALRYKMDSKLSNADASFWGEHANDVLQTGKVIGDVNGDGYTDILMGAPKNNDGGTSAGQSYLILGKASGWAMDRSASTANASFWGEKADDQSGESVAGAGDVNGDGYDDLLIGAIGNDDGGDFAGQMYLIFGKASGWAMDTKLSNADASFIGENLGDGVGYSQACAGDVNGDGYDDILIGAYWNSEAGNNAGQTYLVFGKPSGWAMDTSVSKANASFWGENGADMAGYSVAGAGDVNGDGYDDFLIAAYGNDDGGGVAGQTYLILGKASGWAMDTSLSKADASFWGENAGDWSGWSVSGAGDVNGDGFDDFLIAAYWNSDGVSFAGQSYLIFGKASGWAMDSKLSNADASFWAEHDYDGSNMVSGAGDVNGDGYDDFLIGALANDDGGNLAGQSYLILGKASGWAMDTSLSMADASFWGEAPTDYSGLSVSGGADVNGDGYDDILIGSSSDEGGVDAGQMYLIFPDSNSRPTKIDSVKAYPNNTFSKETSNATIDDTVFIELRGLDGNSSRKDIAVVNVTSSASSPRGFPLRLMETGPSTGIYRGNFTIKNRTDDARRWIDASYGEMITISSIQDPSKKATVIVPYPTITLVPLKDSLFAKEDVAYKEHYWAIGPPGLSWTFGTNASWLKWDNIDHNLTGTPDNGDVGKYWVRINVSLGKNSSDEHNFTLTVNNTPPGIKTYDVFFAVEDQTYSVDYNSTDDGQGNITWHLKTNASDQFSLDPISGVLSGIPLNNDVGSHYFNVSVDDGNGGRDFTNFTLTVVNVNDPPKILGKDITKVFEDTEYVSNYSVADPDRYDKSFTWGLKTNASWLRIDTSTGKITGLPGNPDVGSYWVNVTVKDTSYTEDSRYFILTVINVNDPPSWNDTPENTTIDYTKTYSFDVNASDIDVGDTLTYGLVDAPIGMTIDATSGIIQWKPTKSDVGSYVIKVTVTDKHASLQEPFTIMVLTDIEDPWINSTPVLITVVGQLYTYDVKAMDNDSTTIEFGLEVYPPGMKIDAQTGKITWTSDPAHIGMVTITLFATDGIHTVRQNYTLTVLAKPLNHKPVINSACKLPDGKTIYSGDTVQCPYSATDADNDTLVWTITGVQDLTFKDGIVTWIPKKAGTYILKFNVSDGKGGFDEKSAMITIDPKKPNDRGMSAVMLGGIVGVVIGTVVAIVGFLLWKKKSRPTPQTLAQTIESPIGIEKQPPGN